MDSETKRLEETLRRLKLTKAEYLILALVRLRNPPVSEAAEYAYAYWKGSSYPVPPLQELQQATGRLIEKGFAWVVDDAVLQKISRATASLSCHGPLSGLPIRGDLDFTQLGAAMMRLTLNMAHPELGIDYYWYHVGDFVYRKSATLVYAYTLEDAYREVRQCRLTPIDNAELIGEWRTAWWHIIPSGVRIRCAPVLD